MVAFSRWLAVASSILISTTCAVQEFNNWGHKRIQLADTSIHFRYSQSGKPPLLLVHGFPQHSPTWRIIGPLLAEHYTVIAPDNRGSGESSLSKSDNYTAAAGGEDLLHILDFLNITSTFVLAHDKGVGLAMSLALERPDRVARLAVVDYPLPGFGYSETVTSPNPYMNWQLAFFAVPDAAQYFIQGREKEMLSWYFWHASYSGNAVIDNDLLDTYTRAISKPGFLRAGMKYFAAAFDDEKYFKAKVSMSKLQMPLLAMGGEASFAPETALRTAFDPVAQHLESYVIPKAGHWVGDENPQAVAARAHEFFTQSPNITSANISSLDLPHLTLFGAVDLTSQTPI